MSVDWKDYKTLEELRRESNLTQQALAKRIGITYQSYAYYEKGRREPDLYMVIRLAGELNLDLKTMILSCLKTRALYNGSYAFDLGCHSKH